MPEGHLLHRAAREQSAALARRPVRVSSPQGRFDVAPYDGRVLRGVEARGKHLLYDVEGADPLHVHLGMRGLFLRYDDLAAAPPRGTRLRLAGEGTAFCLIAPSRCEALTPAARAELLASLGPDPLHEGAGGRADAVARLLAARGSVGAAVVDQAVWAGLGNAWRAELLLLAGVAPDRPVARLAEEEAGALWDLAVELLPLGRDAGQVVSDPAAPDERWVYKRDTCRRCGAPVRTWPVGGRTAYACPVEQR